MSQEESNLDPETVRALEAILMVAMDPVAPALLAQLLEISQATVEALCERLAATYEGAGHGFQLVKVAGGFRFQSHGQQARVSSAALETLAIIAYKQPLSRSQIASIRGVDPEAVMRTLQARGYITEVQRDDGPGQAVLFGTTPLFLERLGIASLEDLPSIADFIPDASVVESLERGLRVVPDDPTLPEQ